MLEFFGIALSTLISEDLACIAAGSLAAQAKMRLGGAIAAALIGIVVGDLLLYCIGFIGGRAALNFPILKKRLSAEKLKRAEDWFAARGSRIIIASRFIPGSRLPTYLAAGVLRVPVLQFALLLIVAAALWTPVLVGFSYASGSLLKSDAPMSPGQTILVVSAALIIAFLAVRLVANLMTAQKRMLLYSRWLRAWRWEFWPMLCLYIPVGFYLLYLGVKSRRLLAFTACNPGIPESGIKGESKSAILEALRGSSHGFGNVAPFRLVRANTDSHLQLKEVEKAIRSFRSGFPVVLKMDVGERGDGVMIAKRREDIQKFVAANPGDFIVQKFIPGREFGVFYYRYPNKKTGQIFAITDKRLITLQGDGRRTLKELIFSDKRARLMAAYHLQRHKARLREVIPQGQIFPLVELGTHCKGALFLDGSHLITDALTRAIDRISKNFAGFYFGRYDIRVSDERHLVQGKKLQIIELNGVTSEATSIYDPKHSLWHAYRVLFRQWRIAHEIGLMNIANGASPITLRQLIRHAL